MKARMNPIRKARSYALTSSETIREATRFPSSRFIHAGCYETVADERDALQARLDEAVALLRGVTYSFVSLSEQSDNNALDLLSIVRKQRNSDLNNAELFLSTLENGGAK